MSPIPHKIRAALEADPFMRRCIYQLRREWDGRCDGRVEWEHAHEFAGAQIQEAWAIVPVCTYHHRGGGMNKQYHKFISLLRARNSDLKKYPKRDWRLDKKLLRKRFLDVRVRSVTKAPIVE